MDRIEGRTAFVTGAASGIGLAIAQALIAAGARVVLADNHAAALQTAVTKLGSNAIAVPLDVTNRADWQAAKAAVAARFGDVEILINNAGIGPDGAHLADMAYETFNRLLSIKITGTFNGISTFAADMRTRGEGHIVNTASMAGLIASARLGAYTASKFAVVGMSEVLRAELAAHGVGVSVLCPGLVATGLAASTQRAGSSPIERPDAAANAGIDAAIVGQAVVDAIRTNQMYIITHGEYRDIVAGRMTRLLAAFDAAPNYQQGKLPGSDVAEA